ncbi:DEAD/DEAH box helicase [Faecousia sp. CLA-AA-H192]|uniref:DEAD/DEAH box helicase n=1 Tax=Faecousia intestinalis TaxID=3133167 RepID=A0ABV1G755_9FIRM|nr:MAG TPA: Chromatin remodeling complex ATPase [Caudoviricetes sp.]
MQYKPHDYQSYATNFILDHPVAAVFLDMGLGKSVISLTAIFDLCLDSFQVRKVLVIAPLRVARDTWPDEIRKWDHLKGLSYSVAVGSEAERKAALQQRAFVYIINRENVQWLVQDSDIPFDYDMVVIDELSSFKSYQAKRFRTLLKVRPSVKRIVGLTGTPSSNGLMDLWAQFRLLDMGQRLGRFITHYRNTYFQPDKRNGQVVFSYKPLPGAEDAIHQKISDITISMKATDHLQMPECIMNEVKVPLSEKERTLYDSMKHDMVVSLGGEEIDAANAAALDNKLSQMANGAVYGEEKKVLHLHDRKLDALEDLIEAANGKPVLVAYWYRHDYDRIAERLHKRHIPFSTMDSSDSIARWNRGEIPVALIHPASAGHGLNIQAGGSTIIWFGLTWSLELYQQVNARLWRQGQKSDTVVIHHIITQGTIDERMMKALHQKDISQSALIEAVKAELGVTK